MIIYGHRGAAHEAPENTLAGFAYARSIGIFNFEFDIHLTLDRQLAVIHDDTVDRTTDGSGRVDAMTMAELQALAAYGRFPDWPERPTIPTLDEVFDLLRDAGKLQVEIKHTAPDRYRPLVTALLDAVTRRDMADQVYVSSFDPLALRTASELAPELPRNLITGNPTDDYIRTAVELGCRMAAPYYQNTTREIVDRLHAEGMLVCCWVGNDAEAIATMREWGVDAVTTDVPSLVMRELGR